MLSSIQTITTHRLNSTSRKLQSQLDKTQKQIVKAINQKDALKLTANQQVIEGYLRLKGTIQEGQSINWNELLSFDVQSLRHLMPNLTFDIDAPRASFLMTAFGFQNHMSTHRGSWEIYPPNKALLKHFIQ